MSQQLERVIERPGMKYHFVKTDKYKTNLIVLKGRAPLNKKDATIRALLPHVLQSGTNTYPTITELRSYLEELYGALFFTDLQKKGENHIISFWLEVANEKFLSDETPLLKKGLTLLADVLLNPKTDGERFDEDIVNKEKRTLKQRIQSVYDDKMRYANLRLVEEMCKGEPYAIPVNGLLEDVDSISSEDLYRYYQKVLDQDEYDLYIIGDFNEDEVTELCDELFPLKGRKLQAPVKTNPQAREEKTVVEREDVLQGKLNIGYRTNITYGDEDYFALQVFNGLFGGFPHSKLFMNVRERASLAYYAASRLESHKGLLLVMTGIEPKNFEKAKSIIQEQMEAMKKGDFTEEQLAQTKAVIQNQMLETLDTARGLTEVLYHNIIAKTDITANEWKEKIRLVTKEDVVKVGEKIQADTIYFLTGLEG